MSSKEKKERFDIRHIKIPSIWESSIFLLIIYAFFFQYGVRTINSFMLVLNAVCILYGVANFVTGPYKRLKTFYYWIIAFVFVSFLFSLCFGVSTYASLYLGIRMIEYCLTGFSIFLFCISRENRFRKILFYTWLSIFLLAIFVLLKGTSVDYGDALGIGSLNTNELSSFYILMVFCAFYLYGETDVKIQKLIVWMSLLLVFFVQIKTASRRGFIVMVFMIVINIIWGIIPFSNHKNSRRKIIIYSLLIIIGAIAFVGLRDYILNSTTLGARLSGNMTGGDMLRERYRQFALKQFLLHPVFGIGIGGVVFLQGVYSHSLYFETIASTGIVGALLLLVGLFVPFKRLSQRILHGLYIDDENRKTNVYLCKIMLVYLVGILVSGMAVVMIYNLYFYLSLGLIAAGTYLTEMRSEKKGSNNESYYSWIGFY